MDNCLRSNALCSHRDISDLSAGIRKQMNRIELLDRGANVTAMVSPIVAGNAVVSALS